jgi:integrase
LLSVVLAVFEWLMPSVHKRPGLSPYFYAAFTDGQGRRRFRCTKTANRAEALVEAERLQRNADALAGRDDPATVPLNAAPELLERFVRLAQKAKAGELTAEDGQALVSDLLAATGQDRLRLETPQTFFTAYLAEKKTTRAKTTAARYKSMATRFLASLGARANKPMRSITARDVAAFRDAEVASGLNAATANLSLVFVRSVFESARRQGIVASNVAEAVENLSSDHAERRAFTREEITRLLGAASEDWKTAIHLAIYAGFRLSDATGLRWDQFDSDRGVIILRPKKESRARAAKKKETVCPSALAEWLRERQGVGAAPITPSLHGRPTNRKNGLSAEFNRLLDSAHIPRRFTGEGARRVADVSFHALRHTAASLAADAGVAEDVRRDVLGQTPRVHRKYVHREVKAVRAALDMVPRIS